MDLPRQCRLCNVQILRRTGDAAGLGNLDEIVQRTQVQSKSRYVRHTRKVFYTRLISAKGGCKAAKCGPIALGAREVSMRRIAIFASILRMAAMPGASVAPAQDNSPSRPITIVNPLPPGGTTDLVARALAAVLEKRLGQPIVVENKSGAAGAVGTALVANA